MKKQTLRALNHGELLTPSELYHIAQNFEMSGHAYDRALERYPEMLEAESRYFAILNSNLTYYQIDGAIFIKLTENFAFIASPVGKIITLYEKNNKNKDFAHYWHMSLIGRQKGGYSWAKTKRGK